MKKYNLAVIFAGGKSSRMGEDKALLPFGSFSTLSSFQYDKLTHLFKNVYISTKEDKFDFDVELIEDIYEESSPLVGLLSIFETLHIEEVFVLSVDAPFVDEEIISKIMQTDIKEYDAIVAKSPNGLEPLCGRYRKTILPILKQQYAKSNHKMQELLNLANTYKVKFDTKQPFMNLNYQTEYKKALRFIEE